MKTQTEQPKDKLSGKNNCLYNGLTFIGRTERAEEIAKVMNMHDESIQTLKELRLEVMNILSRGKNYTPTWNEYDRLRTAEEKAEIFLKQTEQK